MKERLRFAPSPTGQVHIGNIRTAIFNWLAARHAGGTFILRIEDTDLERSTKEAIDTLMECMKWLGLDYDEEVLYQTTQAPVHLDAACKLLAVGNAYYGDLGENEKSPVYFRIPYDCNDFPFINILGETEVVLAPNTPLKITGHGVTYSTLTAKGKIAENTACLAGFYQLRVFDASNQPIFSLDDSTLPEIWCGTKSFETDQAVKLKFVRREVFFDDVVKGHLSKQLDSMKDFIIVRSDGSPVFHLGNVCDDITQNITFIVRGDDHVENTFRHLFLFQLLGATPPKYGHLPMIVNAQGKPYSKRDGDAFVGDFKEKGVLPETLFNYLSLLGWSPGDNREKMSLQELAEAFNISKVQHSPARFDQAKLANLNGMYIAELSPADFLQRARDFAKRYDWFAGIQNSEKFAMVAQLMQSRTKLMTDIDGWKYFFYRPTEFDPKGVKKNLSQDTIRSSLEKFAVRLNHADDSVSCSTLEAMLREQEKDDGLSDFALNQPLRVAVCGTPVGASIYETVFCIGIKESAERISIALNATLPSQK